MNAPFRRRIAECEPLAHQWKHTQAHGCAAGSRVAFVVFCVPARWDAQQRGQAAMNDANLRQTQPSSVLYSVQNGSICAALRKVLPQHVKYMRLCWQSQSKANRHPTRGVSLSALVGSILLLAWLSSLSALSSELASRSVAHGATQHGI